MLTINLEYEDDTAPLDWKDVHLPNLQNLRLNSCPLHSVVFTEANTPSLFSLSIENQGPAAEGFNLSLPKLIDIDIQHAQVMLLPAPYGSLRHEDLPCHLIGTYH